MQYLMLAQPTSIEQMGSYQLYVGLWLQLPIYMRPRIEVATVFKTSGPACIYGLVNRDPYIGLLESLGNCGMQPPIQPKLPDQLLLVFSPVNQQPASMGFSKNFVTCRKYQRKRLECNIPQTLHKANYVNLNFWGHFLRRFPLLNNRVSNPKHNLFGNDG